MNPHTVIPASVMKLAAEQDSQEAAEAAFAAAMVRRDRMIQNRRDKLHPMLSKGRVRWLRRQREAGNL